MGDKVESLGLHVNQLFLVAIFGTPPGNSAEFFSFPEELFEYLRTSHCLFLIMGDVNIDSLGENAPAY